METAKKILDKIKSAKSKYDYNIVNHPAKELDEYMKEQYIMLILSVFRYCKENEEKSLSYALYIAEKIDFSIDIEETVKYVFSMDKRIDDCIESFKIEEIKYLLGFELYILSYMFLKSETEAINYIHEITDMLNIEKSEYEKYRQIYKAIIENDVDCYEFKECYLHSSILRCYLCNLNFTSERSMNESNTFPDFPMNKNYIVKKFGDELRRVSYFDFFITSEMLDNITTRFYGIQVRKCSPEEEQKYRYDEYALKSQKPMGNNAQDCEIDIGAVYIFYNYKNCFNAPAMVISHPLDYIEGIEEYIKKELEV